MHAESIVARVLGGCLGRMHAKRAQGLVRAVAGLLRGGVMSLSAIALHLQGRTRLKHRLKSVDRLLANRVLHQQRASVYAGLARYWLDEVKQVLLVVDWTDVTRDQRWQCLRAAVVIEGRSQTLYEEVHGQAYLGNAQVHRRFIEQVAHMLPEGCKAMVMSDAGFHAPWFKLVVEHGWDFIGRVRGRNYLRVGENGAWIAARDWYAQAGERVRELGLGAYARSNPVAVRALLGKLGNQGRHQRNLYGQISKGRASAENARRAREPWLLVCSPSLQHLSAEAIMALYAQRMRIEQSFRDSKSLRVGLGLETSRSRSAARLQMLLLIGHLASFVQRLIGESAKAQQLELQFMATRRVDRAEISVLTLARRMLDLGAQELQRLMPWRSIPLIRDQARACFA